MRPWPAALLLSVACGAALPSAPDGLSDPCSSVHPCPSSLLCADLPTGNVCVTPRVNGQECPMWGVTIAWSGQTMITGNTTADFGGATVFAGCVLRCPNQTDAECPAKVSCIGKACVPPQP